VFNRKKLIYGKFAQRVPLPTQGIPCKARPAGPVLTESTFDLTLTNYNGGYNMMKQGDAVYQAVVNVCGQVDGKYEPTKEQRAQIKQILFEGFKAGKIVLGKEYTDEELTSYIPGLISNWLRKDKKLNGGVAYVPANPGSRVKDPQVVAMKALLATKTDPAERAEIQEYITKRLAELKPTKTATIDVNALPEELQHLVK
jgi:hypothetical protein